MMYYGIWTVPGRFSGIIFCTPSKAHAEAQIRILRFQYATFVDNVIHLATGFTVREF